MAVIRVPMERLDSNNPIPARGAHQTNLATKLVALVCLAFANAFNFRGMDTVKLVLRMALLSQKTIRHD